jgi:hypothetical protein
MEAPDQLGTLPEGRMSAMGGEPNAEHGIRPQFRRMGLARAVMRGTYIFVAIGSALAGCTATPSLHDAALLAPDQAYFCMAPDGSDAREAFGPDGRVTCPAPARFVSQPFCQAAPNPPSDIGAYYRARAKAARDGSLIGDSFEGQPFCVFRKLGPPLPRS